MIFNIIDRRSRPYRWKKLNAIVEATSHDNCCEDADHQAETDDDVLYDAREGISLQKAVAWANAISSPVTLYLYDEGAGV